MVKLYIEDIVMQLMQVMHLLLEKWRVPDVISLNEHVNDTSDLLPSNNTELANSPLKFIYLNCCSLRR